MQAVEAFLPAHDEFHFLGFERGLDLVLELGHGRGIDAAAERAQRRGQVKVGHDVHRLRVFELGRGSELVDAFGERGDHGLPALAFGGGHPRVLEAAGIDADDGQEFLQRFEAAAGVVVAFRIVAVTRVTAGHEHPVGAGKQGFQREQGIDAARTGDADDTQVRRLGETSDPGSIGAAIGAPVAEEAYDPEFFACQHRHRASTSARIWLSVKWESWMAPCGQVAVQRPQP